VLLVLMKKQNLKLRYQFVNIYFANSKEIGRYQIYCCFINDKIITVAIIQVVPINS